MIATQQSSVPLALGVAGRSDPVTMARRVGAGDGDCPPRRSPAGALLAPGLAIAALVTVNAVGFGRISLSPFGNVFVLARVIYDGPGMMVLRRDCPERGWRLCPWLDRFPATADGFLWDKSSPIMLAGGHKAISGEADAIIRAAMSAEPGRLFAATWDNTIEQLTRFDSGDGLEDWNGPARFMDRPRTFRRAERDAFHAARQQLGTLEVPPPLAVAHRARRAGGDRRRVGSAADRLAPAPRRGLVPGDLTAGVADQRRDYRRPLRPVRPLSEPDRLASRVHRITQRGGPVAAGASGASRAMMNAGRFLVGVGGDGIGAVLGRRRVHRRSVDRPVGTGDRCHRRRRSRVAVGHRQRFVRGRHRATRHH